MTKPLHDGFHTKALDDGNIEFAFVVRGSSHVNGFMTPDQVSALAANLLNTSSAAFQNAELSLPEMSNFRCPSVTVTRWSVGKPQEKDQFVMAAECGRAVVAFNIPTEHLRPIARSLIEASYGARSISNGRVVREGLSDCASLIRGMAGLIGGRTRTAVRRNWSALSAVVTGRAPRIFRNISVGANFSAPEYAPVSECIYCGSNVYSEKEGVRASPLGAEHIVPEGLGGTLELPNASCQRCEDTTGRLVEGDVLRRTLKALRVHLKLKKKGSGSHPKTLPLDARFDGKDRSVDVPVEDYPIIFSMLHFPPPAFVPAHVGPGRNIVGAVTAVLKYDKKALYRKYRINEFATAYWDSQMFTRMLAKIAHSLAVAEIGRDAFKPLLLDLICKGDVLAMGLVGGTPFDTPLRKSQALHELELGFQRANGVSYVVARIRLFARYNGPQYHVVVGESLETRMSIARRVLWNKVSRMFAP